jgi:Domain of unknown function (DUF5666)
MTILKAAGASAASLLFATSLALAPKPAVAQQPPQAPPPVRVAGTIESVNGSSFVLKQKDGSDVTVKVADKAQIFGAEPAKVADIKTGDYIAVGATPQPDGSQKAILVTIFAETMRGVGEGFHPWDRPNTTMTNATVDTTVAGVDGQVVTVKYKDGDKRIIIGSDAEVRRYVPSDSTELKAGAHIALPRAEKQPDGSLQTARIYVGRNGVMP